MYKVVTPIGMGRARGLGCGCGCGGSCSQQQIPGVGQVVASPTYSFANLGTDVSNLASDLFLNSDGSLNWTAVGFAGVAAALIFVNWGNTTRRRK